jgi:hypothetical protein
VVVGHEPIELPNWRKPEDRRRSMPTRPPFVDLSKLQFLVVQEDEIPLPAAG